MRVLAASRRQTVVGRRGCRHVSAVQARDRVKGRDNSEHVCPERRYRSVQRRELHACEDAARRLFTARRGQNVVRRHGRVDAGNSDTRTEGTTGRAEARNTDEYEGPDEISSRRAGGRHGEVQGRHVLLRQAASRSVLTAWRRRGVVQIAG